MIIRDLHVIGISMGPSKADSPLIVDSDAVLPLALPREFLQTISRRTPEIFDCFSGVQDNQLSLGKVL